MFKRIESYWIQIIAHNFFTLRYTHGPLPPGTNVHANISLSMFSTLFKATDPSPTYAATAIVESWTFYKPDGTKSEAQAGRGFSQNAIAVENCATITFALQGLRTQAIAQINILTL
jgi:hypothetical protein